MTLRDRLIRLAYARPELRSGLLPLVRHARAPDLAHYGLDGLVRGEPTTLYHGTTRSFRKFDLGRSRTELVDAFYGAGIFLTPSKRVAWSYANANRNIGFDEDIIDDLRASNPPAATFMRALYERGDAAWEPHAYPGGMVRLEEDIGVDPNLVADVAQYIIGSKVQPLGGDEPVHIFNTSTGMPSFVYDTLDEIGLDSKKYRPKVYTVEVKVENTLVTASKAQARSARSRGYDSVVFHGSDLVHGVPEVAVFDSRVVRVKGVEVD